MDHLELTEVQRDRFHDAVTMSQVGQDRAIALPSSAYGSLAKLLAQQASLQEASLDVLIDISFNGTRPLRLHTPELPHHVQLRQLAILALAGVFKTSLGYYTTHIYGERYGDSNKLAVWDIRSAPRQSLVADMITCLQTTETTKSHRQILKATLQALADFVGVDSAVLDNRSVQERRCLTLISQDMVVVLLKLLCVDVLAQYEVCCLAAQVAEKTLHIAHEWTSLPLGKRKVTEAISIGSSLVTPLLISLLTDFQTNTEVSRKCSSEGATGLQSALQHLFGLVQALLGHCTSEQTQQLLVPLAGSLYTSIRLVPEEGLIRENIERATCELTSRWRPSVLSSCIQLLCQLAAENDTAMALVVVLLKSPLSQLRQRCLLTKFSEHALRRYQNDDLPYLPRAVRLGAVETVVALLLQHQTRAHWSQEDCAGRDILDVLAKLVFSSQLQLSHLTERAGIDCISAIDLLICVVGDRQIPILNRCLAQLILCRCQSRQEEHEMDLLLGRTKSLQALAELLHDMYEHASLWGPTICTNMRGARKRSFKLGSDCYASPIEATVGILEKLTDADDSGGNDIIEEEAVPALASALVRLLHKDSNEECIRHRFRMFDQEVVSDSTLRILVRLSESSVCSRSLAMFLQSSANIDILLQVLISAEEGSPAKRIHAREVLRAVLDKINDWHEDGVLVRSYAADRDFGSQCWPGEYQLVPCVEMRTKEQVCNQIISALLPALVVSENRMSILLLISPMKLNTLEHRPKGLIEAIGDCLISPDPCIFIEACICLCDNRDHEDCEPLPIEVGAELRCNQLEAVVERLADEDCGQHAVFLLQSIPKHLPASIVVRIIAMLYNPSDVKVSAALQVLAKLSADLCTAECMHTAASLLHSLDVDVQYWAINFIKEMAEPGSVGAIVAANALGTFIELCRSEDDDVRDIAEDVVVGHIDLDLVDDDMLVNAVSMLDAGDEVQHYLCLMFIAYGENSEADFDRMIRLLGMILRLLSAHQSDTVMPSDTLISALRVFTALCETLCRDRRYCAAVAKQPGIPQAIVDLLLASTGEAAHKYEGYQGVAARAIRALASLPPLHSERFIGSFVKLLDQSPGFEDFTPSCPVVDAAADALRRFHPQLLLPNFQLLKSITDSMCIYDKARRGLTGLIRGTEQWRANVLALVVSTRCMKDRYASRAPRYPVLAGIATSMSKLMTKSWCNTYGANCYSWPSLSQANPEEVC